MTVVTFGDPIASGVHDARATESLWMAVFLTSHAFHIIDIAFNIEGSVLSNPSRVSDNDREAETSETFTSQ